MTNTSPGSRPQQPPVDDLPDLPATPTGWFRHHKGGLYEVMGAARHSESLEPMVVYRPLQGKGGLWVRPHAMFFERLSVDGREVARFEPIDPPVDSGSTA